MEHLFDSDTAASGVVGIEIVFVGKGVGRVGQRFPVSAAAARTVTLNIMIQVVAVTVV